MIERGRQGEREATLLWAALGGSVVRFCSAGLGSLVCSFNATFGQADNVFHVPLHVRTHTHTTKHAQYACVCLGNVCLGNAVRLFSRQRVAFVCDVLCDQLIDVDCDADADADADSDAAAPAA